VDVFKVLDKHDLPRALTINSLDDRFLAVASVFGVREINVTNLLRER
jgi:hypothetical protein